MKHASCPSCGGTCMKSCMKYGKNKSGTQRWRCNVCSMIITPKLMFAENSVRLACYSE